MLKISIITFVHANLSNNRKPLLKECLESVSSQNYGNYEHIIVDDGSTVDIESLVNQFSNTVYYKKEQTGIVTNCTTFNIGNSIASGDLAIYLASDDLQTPSTLHSMAKAFEENPQIDVVLGTVKVVDQFAREIIYEPNLEKIFNEQHTGNHINGCCLMWRRKDDLLQKLSPNSIGFCSDYDFYSLTVNSRSVMTIPECVGIYRAVLDSTRFKTRNLKNTFSQPRHFEFMKKMIPEKIKRHLRRKTTPRKNVYSPIMSSKKFDKHFFQYSKGARLNFVKSRILNKFEIPSHDTLSSFDKVSIQVSFNNLTKQVQKSIDKRDWEAAHKYQISRCPDYQRAWEQISSLSENIKLLDFDELNLNTIILMNVLQDKYYFDVQYNGRKNNWLFELCPMMSIRNFYSKPFSVNQDLMDYLGISDNAGISVS